VQLPMGRMTEAHMPHLGAVRRQKAMVRVRGVFIGDDAQQIELACGVTLEKSRPVLKSLIEKLKGSNVTETRLSRVRV
jgi:hypothetical protein